MGLPAVAAKPRTSREDGTPVVAGGTAPRLRRRLRRVSLHSLREPRLVGGSDLASVSHVNDLSKSAGHSGALRRNGNLRRAPHPDWLKAGKPEIRNQTRRRRISHAMQSVLLQQSYSLDEFARLNDIALTTVRGEIKSGRLVARKVGRRTIITPEDANDWRNRLPKVQPRVRVPDGEDWRAIRTIPPA